MTHTLFDAGRRRTSDEAALANYDALRVLAQETDQQQHAVAAAQEFLELSTNRYTGGVVTYLQVLTAQTLTLANERNAIGVCDRTLALACQPNAELMRS
jgi:outer membrane protein TolC